MSDVMSMMRQSHIRFKDGSGVHQTRHIHQKWTAWWSDQTPLRDDDGLLSLFDSVEAAIAAITAGGEGLLSGWE